jgi:O-antigen/teichoic acid export membrane protein
LDLFTAYNKQKYNFYFIVLITAIVVISNIFLIPSYDFVGSSISRLIAGIFGFLFLILVLNKIIKIRMGFISVRLLFATFIFLTSIYLFSTISPFANIIISFILFIPIVILTKVFTQSEMKIIIQLVNNKKVISWVNKYYRFEE